jgi:hypothetical protein
MSQRTCKLASEINPFSISEKTSSSKIELRYLGLLMYIFFLDNKLRASTCFIFDNNHGTERIFCLFTYCSIIKILLLIAIKF